MFASKRALLNRSLKGIPLNFSRTGVAYNSRGETVAANTPRFESVDGKTGILIEEATTNLLTAEVSQTLSEAYTTAKLNGTYTFSCKTGSYELSGGATGTVTPSNPQTKSIENATVTLTPVGGAATFNQIELKPYPTSWTLGGTTRNAETLTMSSSVLNIDTNGTVNLLSEQASQELTSGSPYTTSTLTAGVTYTFSCKTGSYELSGGATGTVTPGNPRTVTPGAVTVTLTGDSTYNQLEPRASATDWILGGTQRNTGQGTFECEVYFNPSFKNTTVAHRVLYTEAQNANCIINLRNNSGNIGAGMTRRDGASSNVVTGIAGIAEGWHKLAMTWDNTILKFFIDGVSVGTPVSNPNMPTLYGLYLYIGSQDENGGFMDTVCRNVVISRVKRSDADIQARASAPTFPIDRQVTAYALLENDLKCVAV